jgi:hypothetical protein
VEWIKKLPNWIKGTIGLLTLIITFTVMFFSNIYISVTVTIVTILVTGFCCSLYFAFSKKKSEVWDGYSYRYPRYRHWALVALVFIPSLAIALTLLEPSRRFINIGFTGTPTPSPTSTHIATKTATPAPNNTLGLQLNDNIRKPTIKSIIIAEDENNYRIEITTSNPLDKEVLVNKIAIRQNSSAKILCAHMPSERYVLSGHITVINATDSEVKFNVPVSSQDENLSGYQYLGQGSVNNNCGVRRVELGFDTSFILMSKSYSGLYIDMPKSFNVTEATSFQFFFEPFTRPLDTKSIFVSLIPYTPSEYWDFQVSIELVTDEGIMTFTKDYLQE